MNRIEQAAARLEAHRAEVAEDAAARRAAQKREHMRTKRSNVRVSADARVVTEWKRLQRAERRLAATPEGRRAAEFKLTLSILLTQKESDMDLQIHTLSATATEGFGHAGDALAVELKHATARGDRAAERRLTRAIERNAMYFEKFKTLRDGFAEKLARRDQLNRYAGKHNLSRSFVLAQFDLAA